MKTFFTGAVLLAGLCAIYGNGSEGNNELVAQASRLAASLQAEALGTQNKTDDANIGNEKRITTEYPELDALIEKVFETTQVRDDYGRQVLELVPTFTNNGAVGNGVNLSCRSRSPTTSSCCATVIS